MPGFAQMVYYGLDSYVPIRALIGRRNTFLFDGSEHLARRRLIVGPLHGRNIADNAEHVMEVIDRGLKSWPTGRRFAALPTFRRVTFDLMTYRALGHPEAEGNR
jgi:cytochrome P450